MAVHPVHEALTTQYVKQLLKIKARQLLRRPEFRGAESSDVQQELAVHVLAKAHLFDPARGATATFIARVVDSAAAFMCRHRGCLKRGSRLRILSLEAPVSFDDDRRQSLRDMLTEDDGGRATGTPGSTLAGRRESLMDLSSAIAAMTLEQQKVALLLMQGGCETSISRDAGISRRRVRASMEALRDQLKQAGLRDF